MDDMDVEAREFRREWFRAAEGGATLKLREMIEHGIKVDARNNASWTAAMLAARQGRDKVVEALCEAGAELDACGPDGMTAAMAAAMRGQAKCLGILLAAGASVDLRDARGRSAAMRAAVHARNDCLAMLLDAGADLEAADEGGSRIEELADPEGKELVRAERARREALAIGSELRAGALAAPRRPKAL